MRKTAWLALLAALTLPACGPSVDLSTGLQVTDVSTGWFDTGPQADGKNKLVPSVSFRFKNVSQQTLPTLQANIVFRRTNEDKEWGAMFERVTGGDGLKPGEASDVKTIRSPLGYTGTESRQQMLANSQFVDAKADIFAKYGSGQWVKVGSTPVDRRLLEK